MSKPFSPEFYESLGLIINGTAGTSNDIFISLQSVNQSLTASEKVQAALTGLSAIDSYVRMAVQKKGGGVVG